MNIVIRPHYDRNGFAGFVISAFNRHLQDYEVCGRLYKLHKHAVLALRMLEAV